jgi:non-canonical purine NTP pyrophosphatase (RdgB/HAM1 family)
MQRLKVEGIYSMVEKIGNFGAEAKTIVGYAKDPEKVYFFEGSIKGKIVSPSGATNFGWDPIFKPEGSNKTFQEMAKEEKNAMSMRRIAIEKLNEFLKK